MKPAIGFVGLGTMGKWMAINLVKKGFPLNFFARKKEAIEILEREGGKYVPSLKGLARESEWLVFCVSDTAAVEEVLFGKEGLAEELKPGKIVIDCGTIHPLPTRKIAETLKAEGVPFLDAPISGMEARAKAGTLTIMVGGEREIFEKARPVFEALGNKIIYAGQSGNGQLMKMINQVMFDIHCAAIAELLPLAVKMGLDAEQTLEVVKTGTGQCFAVENFGPLILDRNFGPGYPLEDAYKDMIHAAEISSAHRVPLPVTAGCMLTYQMALDQGLGRENKGAMIKVWENALKVEVRRTKEEGKR